MKKLLFLALFAIAETFTSCTTDQTISATVVSTPIQNIADKVCGFYSFDVITDCGDTVSVWTESKKRFDVCKGKKVELIVIEMARKPILIKVL